MLILLFTAFRYVYLFWSAVVRAWKVRLVIRKKIRIQKTHDKKKEEGKPKISGEKNVSTKIFRVFIWFKLWEYPLRTPSVLRQYYQFFKVKIYSGTDNFKTTLRQFQRCIINESTPKAFFTHRTTDRWSQFWNLSFSFFFVVQKKRRFSPSFFL